MNFPSPTPRSSRDISFHATSENHFLLDEDEEEEPEEDFAKEQEEDEDLHLNRKS
ncbi:MAG: hypothetical protein ACREFE_11835 [Limisphaerales bacterium]